MKSKVCLANTGKLRLVRFYKNAFKLITLPYHPLKILTLISKCPYIIGLTKGGFRAKGCITPSSQLRLFSNKRNFVCGATFSVQLKKLNCFELWLPIIWQTMMLCLQNFASWKTGSTLLPIISPLLLHLSI